MSVLRSLRKNLPQAVDYVTVDTRYGNHPILLFLVPRAVVEEPGDPGEYEISSIAVINNREGTSVTAFSDSNVVLPSGPKYLISLSLSTANFTDYEYDLVYYGADAKVTNVVLGA